MKKLLQELISRWKSESPIFWKKVTNISLTLGSSAAAMLGADKLFELQSYGVSPMIFTICGYVITACAAMGLMAKLTKQDNGNN